MNFLPSDLAALILDRLHTLDLLHLYDAYKGHPRHWFVRAHCDSALKKMREEYPHCNGIDAVVSAEHHAAYMRHYLWTRHGYCAHFDRAFRRRPFHCADSATGMCWGSRPTVDNRVCPACTNHDYSKSCTCLNPITQTRYMFCLDPGFVQLHHPCVTLAARKESSPPCFSRW